jgi:hypothetical protein
LRVCDEAESIGVLETCVKIHMCTHINVHR